MATVRQSFDQTTIDEAFRLIRAGEVFADGFWKNRTLTAKMCGYPNGWKEVPRRVQECINQIGKEASARRREERKKLIFSFPSLTKEVLEDIWLRKISVPRNTHPKQLRKIREYVTIRAGFDPKKILLGIESRMEKE